MAGMETGMISGTQTFSDPQQAFYERLDKLSPLTPLTEQQAAWVLGLSLSTLQHWRGDANNPGPPFLKYKDGKTGGSGKRAAVRYELGDLLKFREQMKVGDLTEADDLARMRRDRQLSQITMSVAGFNDWIQIGKPTEMWLVLKEDHGIRDVFSSLGDDHSDPSDGIPMSLRDFLLERLNSRDFVTEWERSAYTELANILDSTTHPGCSAAYTFSQSLLPNEAEAIAVAIRTTVKS